MDITTPLYNRFQGALWGAAIADLLPDAPTLKGRWGKGVVQGCQQLIETGTIRPDLRVTELGEVMGQIVPLSLYFHEDLESLVSHWQAIADHYPLSSQEQTLGLLIGISLSALVEGSVPPDQILTYGRSHWEQFTPHTLATLDTLLAQPSPLIQGLFSFLNSSHSFPGAIALAQQHHLEPSLSACIAATLCGTYQTRLGIPLPWQIFLQEKIQHSSTPWPHEIQSLNTLTTDLLASWSGADLVSIQP